MKLLTKKIFYTFSSFILVFLNSFSTALAATGINLEWSHQLSSKLKWSVANVDVVIENWVIYFIWFLYLIAFIMMVWGWVMILTAAWNEDKVKKGTSTILQAIAWLIVVFIASSIIELVIGWLFGNS